MEETENYEQLPQISGAMRRRANRGDPTAAAHAFGSLSKTRSEAVTVADLGICGLWGFGWRTWGCISDDYAGYLQISPFGNVKFAEVRRDSIIGMDLRMEGGGTLPLTLISLTLLYFFVAISLLNLAMMGGWPEYNPLNPNWAYWNIFAYWAFVCMPLPFFLYYTARFFHYRARTGIQLRTMGETLWIFASPRRRKKLLSLMSEL
ncbi:MAG: hypothetical protein AAGJ79_05475 [Verrucomicrobiota bacterium]